MNTTTRFHSFEGLIVDRTENKNRHAADQLTHVYNVVKEIRNPTILEFGIDRGASTTVFLQVCEENGGKLASVDIADCSAISDSPLWTFVQSSSTAVSTIVSHAPFLEYGIDFLYIDSAHTRAHVEKEVYGWFRYLKQDAVIMFDDVDPHIYRRGERKDNPRFEQSWEEIGAFVREFFYANEDTLDLAIRYGSTGLAEIRKHSALGVEPRRAVREQKRGIRSRVRLAAAFAYKQFIPGVSPASQA
jgi:predicted O-methyltransferase YrrM